MGQPVKLSISPATATIALDGSVQFTVVLTDLAGTEQSPTFPFVWTSSNPTLATVDASGLLTTYDPTDPNTLNPGGTVTITVTYPWASAPESGATIYAEATIQVLATPARTVYYRAQAGGATSLEEAENWPSANLWSGGWKNVPQSLTE